MVSPLAVVFSALMLAGSGTAPAQTPAAQPAMAAFEHGCSVWYEECYYCGDPGWWTCDYRCTLCHGELVCEPTGWICPYSASGDKLSSLFAPAPSSRPLSCRSTPHS